MFKCMIACTPVILPRSFSPCNELTIIDLSSVVIVYVSSPICDCLLNTRKLPSSSMCSQEDDNEGIRAVRRRKSWHDVVVAVEKQRGVSWDEFSVVRGDWGKAAVFYFARKYAGMTLKEVGDAAGGVKYPAVSQLVKRFEKRMNEDRRLRRHVSEIDQMLKIQT